MASASVTARHNKSGTSYKLQYRLAGRASAITFGDQDEANAWCSIFRERGVEEGLALYQQQLASLEASEAEHEVAPPAEGHIWTVRDIVEDYITNEGGISPGQRRKYRKEAARDIYPTLGHLPETGMNRQIGIDWIAYLMTPASQQDPTGMARARKIHGQAAKVLGSKSVANRHGLLSGAFNRRVRAHHLPYNPVTGLSISQGAGGDEMTFLTGEEFWLWYDCTPKHWQPFVLTLVSAGLRFSEAVALRVRDVDLAARRIRITRAVKLDEEGSRYIGSPKSAAGKRTIGIDEGLVPSLEPLVRGRGPNELVFLNTKGDPVNDSTFRNAWIKIREQAEKKGLAKHFRIHDTRHTFASWALDSGTVNMFMLAKIMGHGDIGQLEKRYGHLLPGALDTVADAIAAAKGSRTGQTIAQLEQKLAELKGELPAVPVGQAGPTVPLPRRVEETESAG